MSQFEGFGKYLLLEKLAMGGMAEVYLAKSTGASGVNKFLAIKRILPQFSQNQEFIAMFKEEAKIAVNLNHSNVVSIFDFGIEKNQFFLVMEYVEGRNLRQILNEFKKNSVQFTTEQIVYMVKEVAAGLDHAHRCIDGSTGRPLNITHRDMSPQNIMVSFEGEVKVIDFGIAKAESQIEETKAGTLKGKFGYMSPEQADGQVVDLRTDIFSLGIVLWELLANDRLFTSNSEAAILRKIRDCQIPSISRINPSVSPELEKIVNKALTKDKNIRYQTAAALHRDLNRFLNTHYPEFSPHDFSIFIKNSFTSAYQEQKRKLVEYARAKIEDHTAPAKSVGYKKVAQDNVAEGTDVDGAPDKENTGNLKLNGASDIKIDLSDIANAGNKGRRKQLPNQNIKAPQNSPAATNAQTPGHPPIPTIEDLNLQVESAQPAPPHVGAQAATPNPFIAPNAPIHTHTNIERTNIRNASITKKRSSSETTKSRSKQRLSNSQSAGPNYFIRIALALILVIGGVFVWKKGLPFKAEQLQLAQNLKPTLPINNSGTAKDPLEQKPADMGVVEQASNAPQYVVTINSNPSGAKIFIDGEDTGEITPHIRSMTKNQKITLSLKKDNFLPYDREISITQDAFIIDATLQPATKMAYVSIRIRNGGENPVIEVNGRKLSEKLPIERYPIPSGIPIVVKATNPFTGTYAEQTITVGAEQKKTIDLVLTKMSPSHK